MIINDFLKPKRRFHADAYRVSRSFVSPLHVMTHGLGNAFKVDQDQFFPPSVPVSSLTGSSTAPGTTST